MAENNEVRLDKWLWAARFYKTRSIAKAMIEGGKVHYNGQRAKVSKNVEIGAMIKLRQGSDEKEIEVIALSDQRRGAPEAQLLYQETAQSVKNAKKWRGQEKIMPFQCRILIVVQTKKERRDLLKFKHQDEVLENKKCSQDRTDLLFYPVWIPSTQFKSRVKYFFDAMNVTIFIYFVVNLIDQKHPLLYNAKLIL